MEDGPKPMSHAERWSLAVKIADALHAHYGSLLLAVGVYGSLGRGEDGPYSDIEMHCIVRGEGIDTCFEWSTGPWKAEVDVYSPDEILREAAFIDGDWSITHSAYVHIRSIYDPGNFFQMLSHVALSQPEAAFKERCEEVIVGELYELVGKIRNACFAQNHAMLAVHTTRLAVWGACLLGLHYRHLFRSAGLIFEEVLRFPDPPDGLVGLVQMAMKGDFSDPAAILVLTNRFWRGVTAWAQRNDLEIETSLPVLLSGSADV